MESPEPLRPPRDGLPGLVVFTDLDGTLLDHHDYSWRSAAPAVERLRRLEVPLVLNSSKTRAEMVALRRELDNFHPFATENGSAVFVPRGYFDAGATPAEDDFEVELLGPRRDELLAVLHAIRRRRGFRFAGFADFDVAAVRRHTGLDHHAALAAMDRHGTEPLLWLDERQPASELARELEAEGLRLVTGGRFLHAMGATDKGRATGWLLDRYRARWGEVRALALGDSDNDIEMLRAVECPVVIPRVTGRPLDPGPLPGLVRAPKPGAAGWRWAVDQWLNRTLGEQ